MAIVVIVLLLVAVAFGVGLWVSTQTELMNALRPWSPFIPDGKRKLRARGGATKEKIDWVTGKRLRP